MSARCWKRTVQELTRTCPEEGVAVPLVALKMRDPDANPCATIELESIDEVIVPAVVLVPPELQVNRPVRVSVLPRTDRLLNGRIERLVGRFPRLRPCAFLHSHPFARGSTCPSRGPRCDDQGHMLPLLERNRESGLNTSFSFIACRDLSGESWVIRAFALDRRREIVDLGVVEVAPDDSPRFRDALAPSLWRRPDTRGLLAQWREELARRGVRFQLDDLFGGWLRTVVEVDRRSSMVMLVPVDFPGRPADVFVVDRGTGSARRLEPGSPGLSTAESWAQVLDRQREAEHVGP